GHYQLVGDHVGPIAITPDMIEFIDNTVAGDIGRTTIRLNFLEPLPDDRYTLTIFDSLTDDPGNALDGESNAFEPQEDPTFPSGDGVPGGDFVARFTIDSRPEIGSFVPQGINIDINGNFVWDPATNEIGDDATNVDLAFTLPAYSGGALIPGGLSVHDRVFTGRFSALAGPTVTSGRLFDQLAAYGNYSGTWRWLIDLDSDGVVYGNGDPDLVNDILTTQPPIAGLPNFEVGAVPVAGNFDGNAANGDEIGLYRNGTWVLDSVKNYVLTGGATDLVVINGLQGHPVVGDFDGDGLDDLAVFNDNTWYFDMAATGGLGNFNGNANADQTLVWGFPGVLDRPVAADMDQDGIDDIGMWVPRNGATPSQIIAEWYFLVSGGAGPAAGSIAAINHPFSPVPFGNDLFAQFGDELALPIVGNFDPPVASSSGVDQGSVLEGDYNSDGIVDYGDYTVWSSAYGTSNSAADGNGDGVVNSADYSIWRDNMGRVAAVSSVAAPYAPVVYADYPEVGDPFVASGGLEALFAAYSADSTNTQDAGDAALDSTGPVAAGQDDALLLLAAGVDDESLREVISTGAAAASGDAEDGETDDYLAALDEGIATF
ncbi:MAG: hypothetical protein KDA37_14195, partial [Planctomycetales bacterium]|nr:hypothetical protein [Planctomycetales bacterium]